jgi:hypothetical protein
MPRAPRGEKRPADVIGAAIMVAKIATGRSRGRDSSPRWGWPLLTHRCVN